jgi:hypothetical protein
MGYDPNAGGPQGYGQPMGQSFPVYHPNVGGDVVAGLPVIDLNNNSNNDKVNGSGDVDDLEARLRALDGN